MFMKTDKGGRVPRERNWRLFTLLALSLCQAAQSQIPDGFNPGANSTVNTIIVQPDGKILVGGYFTILAGQPRNHVGQLNSDGSLDEAFNPGTNFYANRVGSLAVQVD